MYRSYRLLYQFNSCNSCKFLFVKQYCCQVIYKNRLYSSSKSKYRLYSDSSCSKNKCRSYSSKNKLIYICKACGASHIKWTGQCNECSQWNTLESQTSSTIHLSSLSSSSSSLNKVNKNHLTWLTESNLKPQKLVNVKSSAVDRLILNDNELTRVLGGGIVSGSVILLGGEPGIGKSTLALQMASLIVEATSKKDDSYNENDQLVLYISGEETAEQLKLRSERIGINESIGTKIALWGENQVESIGVLVQEIKPLAVFIDSIQTMFTNDSASSSGSVTQVRESAVRFLRLAKSLKIPIILLGHVTKSGDIAGPKALEHLVDTVLNFEGSGFRDERLLRVTKNRFGDVNEIACYHMTHEGLVSANPSKLFVQSLKSIPIGSSLSMALQGSRALIVEIQALVTESYNDLRPPRRRAVSLDNDRFHVLLSVLQKYLKIPIYKYDIVVSVAGGLNLKEPAQDLSICAAIWSSSIGKSFNRTIFIGEVALSGELRAVPMLSRRIQEGINLGFKKFVVPKNQPVNRITFKHDIEIIYASHIKEVFSS